LDKRLSNNHKYIWKRYSRISVRNKIYLLGFSLGL